MCSRWLSSKKLQEITVKDQLTEDIQDWMKRTGHKVLQMTFRDPDQISVLLQALDHYRYIQGDCPHELSKGVTALSMYNAILEGLDLYEKYCADAQPEGHDASSTTLPGNDCSHLLAQQERTHSSTVSHPRVQDS
jgi:hypothetical protein